MPAQKIIEQSPLSRSLNVAVRAIASHLFPVGYHTSPDAPETLADIKNYYIKHATYCVYDGGCENTTFDCPETNQDFRAWHDHCHVRLNASLDATGELAVLKEQLFDLVTVYGYQHVFNENWHNILTAEILGQTQYFYNKGQFPTQQKKFAEYYITTHACKLHAEYCLKRARDAVLKGYAHAA